MSAPTGFTGKGNSNRLQAPAFPQVNLLPSDMRDARKDRMVKRLLLLVLAIVIGLCVVLYLFAVGLHVNASNKLEDAQAETAKLRKEKASLQYVVATYTQLEGTELAEYIAMSPEINWKTYIDGIAGTIPDEQSLIRVLAGSDTPTGIVSNGDHAMLKPRVGTMEFETFSDSYPDIGHWLAALEAVPGLHDAYFDTTEIELFDGNVIYKTETRVEMGSSTLSKRLEPEADTPAGAEEGDK